MRIRARIKKWGIKVRKIVKRKRGKLPFKEADLLKGLTPKKSHADELC